MNQELGKEFSMVGALTNVVGDPQTVAGQITAVFTIKGLDGKTQRFQGDTSVTAGFPQAEQVAAAGVPNSATVSGLEKDGKKYATSVTIHSYG